MPTVSKGFAIGRPVEDVWSFLTTPASVAPCVPGCDGYDEVAEDVFDATVTVTVAYTTLTFDAHVEITDQSPPTDLHVEGSAEPTGRIPGSAVVSGDLHLDAADDGTTDGTIEVTFAVRGRLGSLGESAFRSKCDSLTDAFIGNVTAELEGDA